MEEGGQIVCFGIQYFHKPTWDVNVARVEGQKFRRRRPVEENRLIAGYLTSVIQL